MSMSTALPLQWLLKLPPTLRCCAINPLKSRPLQHQTYQPVIIPSRQFGITRALQAKKPKVQKPPAPAPKTPPQPAPHTPPQPTPHTPAAAPRTAEAPRLRRLPRAGAEVSPHLRSLLVDNPQILLYHAPRHRSFFIHSYLLGTIFLIGAIFTPKILDPPDDAAALQVKVPWYVRVSTVSGALFFAILGTAFWLGPSKLIRSVHLVAPAGGGTGLPFLRFESRGSLPLVKRFRAKENYMIDAPIGTVELDKKVFGENFSIHNIKMSGAEEMTAQLANAPQPVTQHEHEQSTLFGAIKNYPKVFLQDIKRMYMRDAFAYLKFPDRPGFWKMDLHDAFVLDQFRPLKAAMVMKPLDRRVVTRIRNTMFSK